MRSVLVCHQKQRWSGRCGSCDRRPSLPGPSRCLGQTVWSNCAHVTAAADAPLRLLRRPRLQAGRPQEPPPAVGLPLLPLRSGWPRQPAHSLVWPRLARAPLVAWMGKAWWHLARPARCPPQPGRGSGRRGHQRAPAPRRRGPRCTSRPPGWPAGSQIAWWPCHR